MFNKVSMCSSCSICSILSGNSEPSCLWCPISVFKATIHLEAVPEPLPAHFPEVYFFDDHLGNAGEMAKYGFNGREASDAGDMDKGEPRMNEPLVDLSGGMP